jgi:hypothetical protein
MPLNNNINNKEELEYSILEYVNNTINNNIMTGGGKKKIKNKIKNTLNNYLTKNKGIIRNKNINLDRETLEKKISEIFNNRFNNNTINNIYSEQMPFMDLLNYYPSAQSNINTNTAPTTPTAPNAQSVSTVPTSPTMPTAPKAKAAEAKAAEAKAAEAKAAEAKAAEAKAAEAKAAEAKAAEAKAAEKAASAEKKKQLKEYSKKIKQLNIINTNGDLEIIKLKKKIDEKIGPLANIPYYKRGNILRINLETAKEIDIIINAYKKLYKRYIKKLYKNIFDIYNKSDIIIEEKNKQASILYENNKIQINNIFQETFNSITKIINRAIIKIDDEKNNYVESLYKQPAQNPDYMSVLPKTAQDTGYVYMNPAQNPDYMIPVTSNNNPEYMSFNVNENNSNKYFDVEANEDLNTDEGNGYMTVGETTQQDNNMGVLGWLANIFGL